MKKGWVEKRIPDICLTVGRVKSRHRPRNEPSLYGRNYPFIQTGDLSNAEGSARENINIGTFDNLVFPMPTVTEQKRIAAKLDTLSEETRRLTHFYERKLSALAVLKQSLLHQAFSGKL